MSERTTEVNAGGEPVLLLHGHVGRADAIAQARQMLAYEQERIERQATAIERGDVVVYQQRGVHVITGRREVTE